MVKKDETVHTRTHKDQAPVSAREECLRAYAELRGIDVGRAKTVKALDLTVEAANVEATPDKANPLNCSACGFVIREEDTFCPFCGDDVSEGEDGGWDAYQKAQQTDDEAEENDEPEEQAAEPEAPAPEPAKEEPKPKVKKIHTIDHTVDAPKPAEPAADKPKNTAAPKAGKADSKEGAVAKNEKKGSEKALKDRVAKIIELEQGIRKSGGEGAWEVGQELFTIHEESRFTEGGFETFKDFCEAQQAKGGLGLSNAQALNYIRVFQTCSKELAGRLGTQKAAMLANAPDAVKTKLLKAATDGSVPAEKLTKAEVSTKIKEARAAAREPGQPARGRPARSKFAALLSDVRRKTQKLVDGTTIFKLDDQVGVEVTVDFKEKKCSMQAVALDE